MIKQSGESWVKGPRMEGTLLLDLPHACYSKPWFLVDKAGQAKPGSLLPWGFSGEGETPVWESGKSKWEAKQYSWICEGSASLRSRCPSLAFQGQHCAISSSWTGEPRYLAANSSSEQGYHRSLFVWSALHHDGHQQPIGNVAVSMRSKVANISPTNRGWIFPRELRFGAQGSSPQVLLHSLSRKKDNGFFETRQGSLTSSQHAHGALTGKLEATLVLHHLLHQHSESLETLV